MQQLLGEEGEFTVKASKGIHILVPRDRIKAKVGMILRTPTSVLFTIPWHNHWIIGTTDTEYDLDKADPTASAEDIEYVLGQANRVLKQKLTKDDIVGTYAGLRPLVAGNADSTAKLSREHLVIETTPGMIVVAGGKYTTYRVMAYDTVDAALKSMGKQAGPCVTKDVPIIGVDGYQAAWNRRELMARPDEPARRPDRAPAQALRLAQRGRPGARSGGCVPPRADPRCRRPTSRPRWCTRHARRAPCTSRTCWSAGPTSTSRSRTVAWKPPRWSRT
jgi:glycerol-3-phosphate dehydrogenase